MVFEWLKLIHVTCAMLSFSGFFVRGIFMISFAHKLKNRGVKILPHIVDTLLLTTALLMLYTLQLSVAENNWLIAKILALLLYIFLGMLALRPGRPKPVRIIAWLSGMVVFMYIVSVALTKSVLGFL